ncbi:MAG: oligosaccharide flippase family protein [Methanomethylophilus sp.]
MKTVMSIVSALVGFVALMFMSRFVGSEYGVMMLWWSFVGLVNLLTDMGFNAACIKSIGEKKDFNACVSSLAVIKTGMSVVLAVIVIGYLGYLYTAGSLTDTIRNIVLMFLLYYLIYNATWVMVCAFDGLLDVTRSSIVQLSEVIVRSSLFIVFAYMQYNVEILSSACLIGITFAFFLACVFFRPYRFHFVRPVLIRDYAGFMKSVAVGITMMTALTYLDKTTVGLFCGTQDVGYYSAAAGVAYAMTTLGLAINNVLLPKFSEQNSRHDAASQRKMLSNAQRYVSLCILPLLIVIALFGTDIVVIFLGEGYAPAGAVLSIMTVFMYSFVMVGIDTQLLYSINCLTAYRRASLIFSAVTIALLFILVPSNIGPITLVGWGIRGAAVSISCGYLLFFLMLSYISRVHIHFTVYPKIYRQAVIVILVSLVLLVVDRLFIDSMNLIELIFIALLCLVVYAVLALVFREITVCEVKKVLYPLFHCHSE